MKKVFLETFGCQMNVLDSELVENQLRALGYTFTPKAEDACVVLYNTCSVRELAEQKVLSRLGRLRQRKRDDAELVIGVIGCMAERDGVGMLKRIPHVDLLCGPSELDQLPSLLENVLLTRKQQHALAGNTSRRSQTLASADEDGLELLDLARSFQPGEKRRQAYIRIVRGCNKFCTYCVVPYTRGAEVSRSPQAILEEARKMVDAGVLEITLLGQTVNHYEHAQTVSTGSGPITRKTTFAQLLQLLHDSLPRLPRLRFITSFPADFGDDILRVIAASPRICRYLHIPAQSGSNRILQAMNRGYTVESYLELLQRARSIVPGIALAGDMIVGFPTETDADYAASRALVENARYKNCFIFKYSPRPGTVAIKRFADDVPDAVKRARNNDLLHVQNRITGEINRALVNTTLEVLCQGPSGWQDEPESVVAGRKSIAVTDACDTRAEKTPQSAHVSPLAAVEGRVPLPQYAPVKAWALPKPPRAAANLATAPGWMQLTGRTGSDQIVVFYGPAAWCGSLIPVRVKSAHGLTLFADAELHGAETVAGSL